jgi:cytochrome c oxidase subunit 2
MSFTVVVETPEAYEEWRRGQVKPASASRSMQGEHVFLSKPCISCHTVRGSLAGGRVGPDLTHLGSRKSIAAGTLPMNRGALAAWIVDPQSIKPGANMPAVRLEAGEIHPLLDYLEGLQ